ncbi:similar to RIKEN cDNA 5830436D01 (predicted), isoform CRA_a [Rattus norvegicus]|uniref:Similar to RIKEN cDNA 5830436D01 (Predicted), isoform CRA_a n=1 Tax=Rattus norvegicus TaxID=10116 RepID=A6I599_RAT|nr:similar to RIKEN cDNA 5830436D01 (predicted), isoform CRA_a [Rattus norvegicus]
MSRVSRSSSEAEDIWEAEDDMTEGDLGYGLRRKPGGIYEVPCSTTSKKRSDGKNPSPPPFPRKGEERSETVFQYSRSKGVQDTCARGCRASGYRRQSSADSNSELSDEQLRRGLREALEEVEILKTELEASQRQLEGKEEALKILQSMEINALQWEMEFDQDRFKNIEESWIQKYDRLNCDNAVLRETLKLRTEEVKMLKSENAVLNQRYLEALAMLDIKQQKVAQENTAEESGFTEVSGLELETLQKSKEEAHITADAFRIAFEQQLTRKNDQALRLARGDVCRRAATWVNGQRMAEDGYPAQRRKKTLGQRLLGILPLENSSKSAEDRNNQDEVLEMLLDLLNDKEEALAHQRKVSYMLARALEDKDTASKENKGKIPMSQISPFGTAWQEAAELCGLRDPHVHVSEPVRCVCSIRHPRKVSGCSRALKRSCSLPSNVFYKLTT